MRRAIDRVACSAIVVMGIAAFAPLFLVVFDVFRMGLPVLMEAGPSFFVDLPPPPGARYLGGIGPALVGTLVLVALGSALGIPIGYFTGLYIAEYPNSRLARWARILSQVMVEFPTIAIGLFVYLAITPALMMLWNSLLGGIFGEMSKFNALAGSISLALVMTPYVAVNTAVAYMSMAREVREAAFSLGLTRFKATVVVLRKVVWRSLLTGMLIGVAKIFGETAPLIFTALGNYVSYFDGLHKPIGTIPLLIYNFALSPYETWHEVAWGASALLLLIVLALFIVARVAAR